MSVSQEDLREKTFTYLRPSLRGGEGIVLERDEEPVLRDLGNGLLIAYLIDQGNSFQYVQHRHLAIAAMDETALHDHGLRNLATLAKTRLRIERSGQVFFGLLDGNFEASLLLVDALWSDRLASFVSSDVMVAVPARDILAFCDSTSLEGIIELRRISARITENGDHLLTPVLYRRVHQAWIPVF